MVQTRESPRNNRGDRINRGKNIATRSNVNSIKKKKKKMNSAAPEVAYITSFTIVRECHISAGPEKNCVSPGGFASSCRELCLR